MKTYSQYENDQALKWAKKIKAVELLGGKCCKCGTKDYLVLEFHHKDSSEKEGEIGKLIPSRRLSEITDELNKCMVLCKNCHAEEHFKNGRGLTLKKELCDISSRELKCEVCGYDGTSLIFHHLGDKTFNISLALARKISGCKFEDIVNEIKKCSILCRNCHWVNHAKNLNALKDLIMHKVAHSAEKKTVDYALVKLLKSSGKGVCEIAKEMNLNKSTISYAYNKV